ncbi:thioredoxin family protein [Pseudomonas sp. Eth.TT006]
MGKYVHSPPRRGKTINGPIQKCDDYNFEDEVLHNATATLVMFSATWNVLSKTLAPMFDKAASEYSGNARFAKVNVDEAPALVTKFKVIIIPTVLLFKGGAVVATLVGVSSKERLIAVLDANI